MIGDTSKPFKAKSNCKNPDRRRRTVPFEAKQQIDSSPSNEKSENER
jgi:hypothetical protein